MTPPPLRLIRGSLEEPDGWSWFCGQCASRPSEEPVSPRGRVCRSCGMGLLLETRSNAAPLRDDAFLVVDSSLTVQAVSRRAQALLGVSEEEAMSQPVAQFLGAADAEAREAGEFINLLRAASAGSEEVRSLFVRPLGAFGVRVIARIVPCGPPRAALVVLGGRSARDFLYVV